MGARPGVHLHGEQEPTSEEDDGDQPRCPPGRLRDCETCAVGSGKEDHGSARDTPWFVDLSLGLEEQGNVEEVLREADGQDLAEADEGPQSGDAAVLACVSSARDCRRGWAGWRTFDAHVQTHVDGGDERGFDPEIARAGRHNGVAEVFEER